MEHESRLLRPANYRNAAGHGAYSVRLQSGHTLGVIHVEGLVFMRSLACPFETIEKEIKSMGPVDAILVDVHAEATSEKQAIDALRWPSGSSGGHAHPCSNRR